MTKEEIRNELSTIPPWLLIRIEYVFMLAIHYWEHPDVVYDFFSRSIETSSPVSKEHFVTPPAYVHFFWAGSPKNPKSHYQSVLPSRDDLYNLHNWREHLKSTNFMPVLWVNDLVWSEIQGQQPWQQGNAHRYDEDIDSIMSKLPDSWSSACKNLLDKLLPEEVPAPAPNARYKNLLMYWRMRYPIGPEYSACIPCGYIVINYQEWMRRWEAYNRHFARLNTILSGLTDHHFACYAKDFFVGIPLKLFPGFYMDLDIRPNHYPFFKNLWQLKSALHNHEINEVHKEIIPLIFKAMHKGNNRVKYEIQLLTYLGNHFHSVDIKQDPDSAAPSFPLEETIKRIQELISKESPNIFLEAENLPSSPYKFKVLNDRENPEGAMAALEPLEAETADIENQILSPPPHLACLSAFR